MKQLTDEMIGKLREPLPAEALSEHPTKSYMSSIKAIFVVERLNEVFGLAGYKIRNQVIEAAPDSKMIVAKAVFTAPEYGIRVEAYGGNDNPDRGDAYKGACTDALTKIGSYLYIGMDVFKGNGPTKNNGGRTNAPKSASRPAPPAPAASSAGKVISADQLKRLHTIVTNTGLTKEEAKRVIKHFDFDSSKDITTDKYDAICRQIEGLRPAQ